jgi:ABC-type multidrug transport system ATPase subunit
VIIEAQDLIKTYGRFDALRGMSLQVPEGSVFALLGANGAGKTTLIKILMNIIRPTSGLARVLGTDSRAIGPAVLAKIGYVSESQLLPGRLRVEKFFRYLRACYVHWDRGIEAALRRELQLPSERRIGALSHGMRMKMALACALPFRPKLLILDEPFSGLDALVREELITGFLQRADETTIFLSSHELDEVERLATHVAFIDAGRLLFQGSIASLTAHAESLLHADATHDRHRVSLRDAFIAMARGAREQDRASVR